MDREAQVTKYVVADIVSASLSWAFFFIFRKYYVATETISHRIEIWSDPNFILGIIFVALYWVLLYYASGYYVNVFRKSRLNELGQTFATTFFGVVILFFALILDDIINSYHNYYVFFLTLFGIHFTLTYIPRAYITSQTSRKVKKGDIAFNTLLIGSNKKALDTYLDINKQFKTTGNKFIGFVSVNGGSDFSLKQYLPYLGKIDFLTELIDKYEIEDVIIAIESSEHEKINQIVNNLSIHNVNIRVIPDMYDIITGSVKLSSIVGVPLVELSNNLMSNWEKSVKHFIDITFSLLALIILSPLCLVLMIAIKLTSKGPVFYSHYRIGKHGKPFKIYKFRSMYCDAESEGPKLSCKGDQRITSLGNIMRKARLDEIPNFINVLKGDMSLVGPRPERKYFIDQIVQRAPHYVHLHKIKPGITSLGQVKYGYAENVDQMIKRLRYDLIYMENMSVFLDFKILIYTLSTLMKRNGV
jgi:exopolysaccharide biosynthesis polyprenyl glycosylphosphotransferase